MKKIVLGEIEKCYACLGAMLDGEPYLFFAAEGKGALKAFHGQEFREVENIWGEVGGTMSIVAVPGEPNTFMASRGFYSMYDAGTSTIELIRYENGHFSHRSIVHLPWLHRFDVVCAEDGTRYIVAATLAESKESKEDWSRPGHLYWAELTDADTMELHQLPGDYFQNHGFFREGNTVYTSSREGVFHILPPKKRGELWQIQQIFDFPVSDIAVCDIDGDGEKEIACIMPFHGDRYEVFKGTTSIFSYPKENNFYHTAISGIIGGKPVFVGGARQITASLFLLTWDNGIHYEELDSGCGPSNTALFHTEQKDMLLAANRQIGQAAVYLFPKR